MMDFGATKSSSDLGWEHKRFIHAYTGSLPFQGEHVCGVWQHCCRGCISLTWDGEKWRWVGLWPLCTSFSFRESDLKQFLLPSHCLCHTHKRHQAPVVLWADSTKHSSFMLVLPEAKERVPTTRQILCASLAVTTKPDKTSTCGPVWHVNVGTEILNKGLAKRAWRTN